MKLGLRHAAIECTSLEAAKAFYTRTLGMALYYDDKDWAMLSSGDTFLSLVLVDGVKQAERRGTHQAHLGFVFSSVEEVRALHARLESLGEKSLGSCKTHRDGSFGFYVADPDGNSVECIFIPLRPIEGKKSKQAWVLLAHGNSDPDWAKPFQKLEKRLQENVPAIQTALCFLGSCGPSLTEALHELQTRGGIEQVTVFPIFLSSGGGHMKEDVPALIHNARKQFPQFSVEVSGALGDSELVHHALLATLVQAAAGFSPPGV
jgi:sirohydrochlorin cobaltochelatase